MYFFGSKMSSLVFFWVHSIRSLNFFGCKILGSVGPPRHIYTRVTHRDKGTTTSVFSIQDKIKEGQIQLDNKEHYRPLEEPMVKETNRRSSSTTS